VFGGVETLFEGGNLVQMTLSKQESSFSARAVASLKQAGMRITRPRMDVVEALETCDRAVSAYALHSLVMERGGRIDVVSVYRILAVLKELGLVHYVGALDGFLACRSPHEHEAHTMHLVCSACHRVVEVPLSNQVAGEAVKGSEGKGFHHGKVHMEVLADSCESCEPA
jgi:Fe2+ or Zn2+ uptake regulation protein